MQCLGSHRVGRAPPPEYGDQEKCKAGWLPDEAVQLEAPAGSAIVYDSRLCTFKPHPSTTIIIKRMCFHTVCTLAYRAPGLPVAECLKREPSSAA